MQNRLAIPSFFVLCSLFTVASEADDKGWPVKGEIVYVAKMLYPERGPSRTATSTGAFATGGSEKNPISYSEGAPPNLGLPACEPVEVRKIKKKWLRVRWVRDRETLSVLGKKWRTVVFPYQAWCVKNYKH